MDFWSIIDTLLDWVLNWRFNLCFYGSIILGVAATSSISNGILRTIIGVGIFIATFVTGTRWTSSS